ncbi:MAG: hypothetical protein AAFW73_19175 [Bacteroidota bacterium]
MKNHFFLLLSLCLLTGCVQCPSGSRQSPGGGTITEFQLANKRARMLMPPGIDINIVDPVGYRSKLKFVPTELASSEDLLLETVALDSGTVHQYIEIAPYDQKAMTPAILATEEGDIQGFTSKIRVEDPPPNLYAFYSDQRGNFAWLIPTDVSPPDAVATTLQFTIPFTEAIEDVDNVFEINLNEEVASTLRLVSFPNVEPPERKFIGLLNRYRIKQILPDGNGGWGYNTDFEPDTFDFSQPTLLLIHGTNAGPNIAFGELLRRHLDLLREKYDNRIFAFVHPSVRRKVKHNGDRLYQEIGEWGFGSLDILSRSRGCLVARYLLEKTAFKTKNKTERMVLIAGPHFGTQGASSDANRQRTVKINGLLKKLPPKSKLDLHDKGRDLALAILLDWEESSEKAGLEIAEDRELVIPGVLDMDTNSHFLQELNSAGSSRPPGTQYFALAHTINLDSTIWTDPQLLKRAGKVAERLDATFADVPSDGINPISGSFGRYWGDDSLAPQIPMDCTYELQASPRAHHINYMYIEEMRRAILHYLLDDSADCL